MTSMNVPLTEGSHCLLRVGNQQFWVCITEVGEAAFRVSFPTRDFPLKDMAVELQFHHEDGFEVIHTTVLEHTGYEDDGLVLARPESVRNYTHRTNARVEADVPVTIHAQTSVRPKVARLLDLSQGGVQLQTDATINFGDAVDIQIALPEEAAHTLTGQVRHVGAGRGAHDRVVGVRFRNPDPEALAAIERFIVLRLMSEHGLG